jgi:hypothetical protein
MSTIRFFFYSAFICFLYFFERILPALNIFNLLVRNNQFFIFLNFYYPIFSWLVRMRTVCIVVTPSFLGVTSRNDRLR